MESYLKILALVAFGTLFAEATKIGSESYNKYCMEASLLPPKSCLDLRCRGKERSGVYTIYPTADKFDSLDVYCDQKSDGGGWTVFQRRMDGSVDFYRNWQNYKLGFGDVNAEHWLGHDNLAAITSIYSNNELQVDLESYENEKEFARYSQFNVANEENKYKLTVAGFTGSSSNAPGDSLAHHDQQFFSTKDNDNDSRPAADCAGKYKGGWWYNVCHHSNLNGIYGSTVFGQGINWYTWKGHRTSVKTTVMKIRGQI